MAEIPLAACRGFTCRKVGEKEKDAVLLRREEMTEVNTLPFPNVVRPSGFLPHYVDSSSTDNLPFQLVFTYIYAEDLIRRLFVTSSCSNVPHFILTCDTFSRHILKSFDESSKLTF